MCDNVYDEDPTSEFAVAMLGFGPTDSTGWLRLELGTNVTVHGVQWRNRCKNLGDQSETAQITVGEAPVSKQVRLALRFNAIMIN